MADFCKHSHKPSFGFPENVQFPRYVNNFNEDTAAFGY
jgi:hypothetical protein